MKKESNEKITALYYRSAVKNEEAIKRQQKRLLNYISENGIENYKVYIDNGYSGSSLERPDLKRLLTDVKNGEISSVVVPDERSLSRSMALHCYLEQYFKEYKTAYKSLQDFTTEAALPYVMYARVGSKKQLTCKICHQTMAPNHGCTGLYAVSGGKKYKRIKAGDKLDFDPNMDDRDLCHDCGVGLGQYHHFNCDAERCPICHNQLISCDCDIEFDEIIDEGDK